MDSVRFFSIKELEAKIHNNELNYEQLEELRIDPRRSAYILWQRYYKKQEEVEKEKLRTYRMFRMERFLFRKDYTSIAGVDEAGRGPLAGPVVAAAVVLPKGDYDIFIRINDSKKLSISVREKIYNCIMRNAKSIGIGLADVEEIDNINIYNAALLAMQRAVEEIKNEVEIALVDGVVAPTLTMPRRPLKKGDTWCASIAAASIVAKVCRDKLMIDYATYYPHYGFNRNKGYATFEHRKALSEFGPSPLHRKSFLKNV